jgi:Mce-associated membrane protein
VSSEGRLAALVVAVVVLLTGFGLEVRYVWFAEEPHATEDHPVAMSDVTQATAVDAAANATAEILSTSWEDYDAQATQAEVLMTDTFAIQYAQTSDDIKQAFLSKKTKVDMTVVWAGVYRASADQVQALLFLDQVVSRGSSVPTTTPYRALVTVVNTDKGWLVSDIQTR